MAIQTRWLVATSLLGAVLSISALSVVVRNLQAGASTDLAPLEFLTEGESGSGAVAQAEIEAEVEGPSPPVAPQITGSLSDRSIRIQPPPMEAQYLNPWTEELEADFWGRMNEALAYFGDRGYGNTNGENEKRSYPFAMMDFIGGNRERSLEFLQREDAQAADNAHTAGIDYYYSFTLKGQMRKYFGFGAFLDPAYRQRMWEGARLWTALDPLHRPHPIYGEGHGGEGWGPDARGSWVDGRNTDNLRAMREVSVYLMAEETGNEAVRQLYKQRLQRYVGALYHIGMGEWDSETYHDHTFTAYLNLYDFAQDPEVKSLAKSALDWLSAAAAVKYYRGGFAGPTKRDYGRSNVVFGSASARFFWHYFGDARVPNLEPPRDLVHAMMSAYRPPLAAVALARKDFARPLELFSSKPTYETWKPDNADQPASWETTFWGHTYQMGSAVSATPAFDVTAFKLLADSATRGVDYFVANTGGDWVRPGKQEGDQIGQYRNLLIWLSDGDRPFFFQIPKTAIAEQEGGIWFVQMDTTWLAIYPLNLSPYEAVEIPDEQFAEIYQQEQTLRSEPLAAPYAGFALEVGEPQAHGSYAEFKAAVQNRGRVDRGAIAEGTVTLHSSTGTTLELRHNPLSDLPTVIRNGEPHRWLDHLDLYASPDGESPISLGWKEGTLRVEAGGHSFESTVTEFNE